MSTTTKKSEKIILNFDQRGFEYADAMFNEKINLIKSIQEVAKSELDLIIEISDSITLKENIFKAVEQKYKSQNLLNLTGEKLVELMQIDLKCITDSSRRLSGYDEVNLENKPTKEQFTNSIDNDKELERYNICLDALKCIDSIIGVYNNKLPLNNLATGFRGILNFNAGTGKLEPCISFVKGNF